MSFRMTGSDIGETKRKDCVSLQSVKGKTKNRLTVVIYRNESLVWTKTEETTGAAITIMDAGTDRICSGS